MEERWSVGQCIEEKGLGRKRERKKKTERLECGREKRGEADKEKKMRWREKKRGRVSEPSARKRHINKTMKGRTYMGIITYLR